MSEPILKLNNVSKVFRKTPDLAERLAILLGQDSSGYSIHAVDNINLEVRRGEVLGLAGESGCGKSTLGRIMGQIHAQTAGSLTWKGKDIATMSRAEQRATNLHIQMIAQDPTASLNPRLRVREIIGEAPYTHGIVSAAKLDDYVIGLMQVVGLDPSYINRFPHQFSGGQRQRIGIARALAVKPELLVCDESVAALDVSIAAQILNLFIDLQAEKDLTYVFISHDLGVVERISDRVAIMYLGRIVELADTKSLFSRPHHPYTRALMAEVPRLDNRKRKFSPIKGEIPSPLDPPKGCHFHPRCPHATEECRTEVPLLRAVGEGHVSACHYDIEVSQAP